MATPPYSEPQAETGDRSPFDRKRLLIFAVLIVLGIITFLVLPFLFVDRGSPGVTDTIGLIPALGVLLG